MPVPSVTNPANEARARRIVEKLRFYHRLGNKAETYRVDHESSHALGQFANQRGRTADTERKPRQFAAYYSVPHLADPYGPRQKLEGLRVGHGW